MLLENRCVYVRGSGQEFIFSVTKVAQNIFYQPMALYEFFGGIATPNF